MRQQPGVSEHGKVWVEDGHEVTVLTNVPNHPGGKIYQGYRNGLLQKGTHNGINVLRMLTWVAPNAGFLLRIANYVFYMLMAIFTAPFVKRPDVVVSTSPQFFCGLAGYFVSRLRRVPWILEVRDLWPETIIAVGAMRKSLAIRLLERVETFAYRRADHIVSVTDSFIDHIVGRGVARSKISVVKNGVDLLFYDPERKVPVLARKLGLSNKFVAAYVGTHGMCHGLDTVLRAADLLRAESGVAILLVGDGAERKNLLKLRDELGLDNVVMLGQQKKERMPDIWAITNASLVVLRDQPVFRTVIPSKIFESMAMKRPIILGVRGEVANIVAEANSGLCIEPESPAGLAEAILSLSEDDKRCKTLGDSGRLYVEQRFDRRQLARRYQKIIADVVGA